MYRIRLQTAHCPAQPGRTLLNHSIGDALRDAARESPQRVALTAYRGDGTLDRQWDYRQLLAESEHLARGLAAVYPQGSRIAVCAPNIPEWVILEYSAALAGLVLVTINPSFQYAEMRHVIEQSGAVAAFHVQSCRGNPIADTLARVQAELPRLQCLFDLQHDTLLATLPHGADGLPSVSALDAAQIQYTSGTSGLPKGAVLSHGGLLNNALLMGERLGINARDCYLNMMPMFHTAGCGLGTLMPLTARARRSSTMSRCPSA